MVHQIVRMAPQPVDVAVQTQAASATKPQDDSASTAAARELGRKKRTNRSAKLKQCKLDARRGQWLSQVKDKGRKDASGGSSPSTERSRSPENSDERSVGDRNGESHDSDFESSINISGLSVGESGHSGSRSVRTGTSSSSFGGSFSGSSSVSDDDDSASFDDWEAVADALGMDDLQKQSIEPSVSDSIGAGSALSNGDLLKNSACFSSEAVAQGILRPEYKGNPSCFEKNRIERTTTCRAWRPDDAFRPSSLPTLSKQMSFPTLLERHHSRGSAIWGSVGTNSLKPSSCPICYEDLDVTDSSFLPCSCGFRLCFFCHKRILEGDGRCPACRKQYGPLEEDEKEPPPVMHLSRACSVHMKI